MEDSLDSSSARLEYVFAEPERERRFEDKRVTWGSEVSSHRVDSSSPDEREARDAEVVYVIGEKMLNLILFERHRGVGMES